MDRRQFLFGLAAFVAAPQVAEAAPKTRYCPPGVYNGQIYVTPGIAVVDGVRVEIGDNIAINQQNDHPNGIYITKAVVGEHDFPLATIEIPGSRMDRKPDQAPPKPRRQGRRDR